MNQNIDRWALRIYKLLNEEVPPWGQMYGHGKINTDFGDTRQYEGAGTFTYNIGDSVGIIHAPKENDFHKRFVGKSGKITKQETRKAGNIYLVKVPGIGEAYFFEEELKLVDALKETSSSGGSGVGMGIQTPNAFAGRSEAGKNKMKRNATNSTGYQITGKIETPDKMEEGER